MIWSTHTKWYENEQPGSKETPPLTEKHTDWKQDIYRYLWQVQTHGKHEAACLPRPDTHVDSYLFYCVQQLKKHKVQVFSMFLNGKCNGLKINLVVSYNWYLCMLRKQGGRHSHKSLNKLIRYSQAPDPDLQSIFSLSYKSLTSLLIPKWRDYWWTRKWSPIPHPQLHHIQGD